MSTLPNPLINQGEPSPKNSILEKVSSDTESPKYDSFDFYEAQINKKGILTGITIHVTKFLKYVNSLGFYRYDIDLDNSIYVQVQDNILKQVSNNTIIDTVLNKVQNSRLNGKVSAEVLHEKLTKGINVYFQKAYLNRLTFEAAPNFIQDTKDKSYHFFKNGFIEVSKGEVELKTYKDLEGYIWENQIIDHDVDLKELEKDSYFDGGVFSEFVQKITSFNHEKKDTLNNYYSMLSIIGYLTHNYKGGERRIINFTDSNIGSGAEGGTGKTLLSKAIGKMRVFSELNGKNFDRNDKHRYQNCSIDTEIVCLNDTKKNFKLESIYNDVTEGLMVEKKNQLPFRIQPKMILASNLPLEVESGSDKRRVFEFAFSSFFGSGKTVNDYFNQWFFEDWENEEWNNFYLFMLDCQRLYFDNDCKLIEAENSTLNERKLLSETAEEFIQFAEEELEMGEAYNKKTLFEKFKSEYSDFDKLTQRNFTIWLNKFGKYRGLNVTKSSRNSNKEKLICFTKPSTPEE